MKRVKKHPPKGLDIIMGLFPMLFTGVLVGIGFYSIILAVVCFYLLPPILWLIIQSIWPMPIGMSYLGKKAEHGNCWYASHQLQWFFISFPAFERILMIVPGLYSSWLRLWGAQIGKKVNWTAECKIVDRPLLIVGDRVLVGNRSYLAAHAIKKKEGRYALWVAPVTIGDDSVLAYSATIGPGVVIGKNCFIEAGANVYPGEKLADGSSYAKA